MVFWASLAPWPNDTAADEMICSHLNGLASSFQCVSRCSTPTRNMARNATVKATRGESTIASAVFSTLLHLITSVPPAESPAPMRPPMRAWLDEDGMPNDHVK